MYSTGYSLTMNKLCSSLKHMKASCLSDNNTANINGIAICANEVNHWQSGSDGSTSDN